MPIYVYKCPNCGATKERTRKVADRDKPLMCLECIKEISHAVAFSDVSRRGAKITDMIRQVTAPGGFKGLEVNH